MDIVKEAQWVFDTEITALQKTQKSLGKDFETIVQLVVNCTGKVIVSGMGKSGHIGAKIAASLASLGTPSFFMHPGEAMHGDLGMVAKNDVVLLMSNSGESDEIVRLLPTLHEIQCITVAITGNSRSTLAKECQYHFYFPHFEEACYMHLAPTSSTTALLVLGDAIAVVASKLRNYTKNDFALHHPAGALGKKLLVKVENVMHTGDENPVVYQDKTAKDALFIMTDKGLGAASVVDSNGKFVGLITDGIIRRALAKDYKFLDEAVKNIMFAQPLTISKDKLAAEALSVMEKHKPRPVTVLPVVDAEHNPVGIVHLTDLLRQGVV